jgi:hypothetical protein
MDRMSTKRTSKEALVRVPVLIVVSAIVAGIAAVGVEVATASHAATAPLVVALDGKFTSAATSSGTFVTGGAVGDHGTHTDVTAVTPVQGPPKLIVITVNCKGKKGSFTFVATVHVSQAGFIAPGTSLSSAPGADRIVKATGAYKPFLGATTAKDLSFTSNPLQPGAPGAPKAPENAVRVIDDFVAH